MSKLSIDEVTRIAALARIGLSEPELEQLSVELSSILSFVEELESADTTDIEPTSQVTGLQDVWREDVVKPCGISRDELLQNAPQTANGFVKVKRIL